MLPLFAISQIRLESLWYIQDSTTVFGRIVPEHVVVVNRENAQMWMMDSTTSATTFTLETWSYKTLLGGGGGGSATDVTFNSNRNILRVWTEHLNIGGSTVDDMLEYLYFAAPTITLNLTPSTPIYEIGTSNNITLSGTTSNPGGATLSNGILENVTDATELEDFGSVLLYTHALIYAPTQTGTSGYYKSSYEFEASQDWVSGGENGTCSANKTVNAIYPYFYGASSQNFYSDTSAIYTTLTKWVKADDATITITGQDINNEYLWFGWPIAYDTITEVFYNNGATNWINDFYSDTVLVNSWSLDNNWINTEYIFLRTKGFKIGIVNSTWDFNQ